MATTQVHRPDLVRAAKPSVETIATSSLVPRQTTEIPEASWSFITPIVKRVAPRWNQSESPDLVKLHAPDEVEVNIANVPLNHIHMPLVANVEIGNLHSQTFINPDYIPIDGFPASITAVDSVMLSHSSISAFNFKFKAQKRSEHFARGPISQFSTEESNHTEPHDTTEAPAGDNRGQHRPTISLRTLEILLKPSPLGVLGTATSFGLDLPHSLYAFQRDGVQFLLDKESGVLLADDMGLGKTVQAIVAFRLLVRRGSATRALVVVPKSVMASWQHHFADWAPELHTITIQESPQHRPSLWDRLRDGAVQAAIVTYATLRNDVQEDLVPPIDVLIADEVQNVKNPVTLQARALAQVSATRRWGLTGTPLENNLDELAAILQFVNASHQRNTNLPALQSEAKRTMIRRRKEEVLDDLPSLLSNVEYVNLTPRQRDAYTRAEVHGISELQGKPRNITNVLTLITRLKQICNGVNGESAKMEWLYDYAYAAREEGDKMLVFSQYLDTLDHIEADLSGLLPLKFTGSLSSRQRSERIDAFQDEHSRHQMMLLQTHTGGVGITLTAANRVVHFDSWWNPAVQSQATARAHRIGQPKTVFEITLVSENTIEERIQDLLESKRELFDRAVNDLSITGVARLLTSDEMYALFDL